ncbi:MAG: pilus assembly protein, partial [Chloroflexi bacterium]|nr:pilus assembly protein [Chloroflexota bacterium]
MARLRWWSARHAQSLVEFALILPVLVLLIFGLIDFGRMFQAYVTIQHAAREAGREGDGVGSKDETGRIEGGEAEEEGEAGQLGDDEDGQAPDPPTGEGARDVGQSPG